MAARLTRTGFGLCPAWTETGKGLKRAGGATSWRGRVRLQVMCPASQVFQITLQVLLLASSILTLKCTLLLVMLIFCFTKITELWKCCNFLLLLPPFVFPVLISLRKMHNNHRLIPVNFKCMALWNEFSLLASPASNFQINLVERDQLYNMSFIFFLYLSNLTCRCYLNHS